MSTESELLDLKPLKIGLKRIFKGPNATMGEMYIRDEFFGYTLEPIWRGQAGDASKKIQNKTCIDAGTYEVVVDFSNHFQRNLPHVLNVPLFEGVRIHGGNTAADTEGCILLGEHTNNVDYVQGCNLLINKLIEFIEVRGKAIITITD